MKLTPIQIAALNELRDWSDRHSRYYWKPKTMDKFCADGLARKEHGGYLITDAGRAALAERGGET